jgi:hypothetical protein
MISININREIYIVTSTMNYYEIIYRKGSCPKQEYYGKWEKIDSSIVLTIGDEKHYISEEEFNSLNHKFKTTYCHGKNIKEGKDTI